MERINGLIVRDTVPAGYADSPAERRGSPTRSSTRSSRSTASRSTARSRVTGVPTAISPGRSGGGSGSGRPPRKRSRLPISRWTAVDKLAADLSATLPEQRETTLVHGDFRLDNTMLDPQDPGRILAVLDWELSTLGDPLADVGLIGVYWGDRDAPPEAHQLTSRVTPGARIPFRVGGFPALRGAVRARHQRACPGTSPSATSSSPSSRPALPPAIRRVAWSVRVSTRPRRRCPDWWERAADARRGTHRIAVWAQ